MRVAKHGERDGPKRQILLIADIFIGSEQHIKSGGLGGFQQFAVLERLPPSLSGGLDCRFFKEWTDRDRRTLETTGALSSHPSKARWSNSFCTSMSQSCKE